MIAYHFPPLVGSSGVQRTLRFVQHLPSLGWQPMVLSADARAYEATGGDLLAEIPANTVVRRAFALDTARHLSVRGRYLGWMARPDRWVSWKFAAIREGRRMIREFKPDVIWSTYPIATAHIIAAALHRYSKIPWVADFRDPMAHAGYPTDPAIWESFARTQAQALTHAALCVFASPGAARDYRERYPEAASRIVVLENGYDEETFAQAGIGIDPHPTLRDGPLILLHSGIVYPSERDPTELMAALARLRDAGTLRPSDLCIRFRAAVHEDHLRAQAASYGVQDFIELCPSVAYLDAVREMLTVDALLVMQGSNCNTQVPAKIYEYVRAGKPILALTDPDGDTAGFLRKMGLPDSARLDSADEIARSLLALFGDLRRGTVKLPQVKAVQDASRRVRSQAFAELLDQLVARRGAAA